MPIRWKDQTPDELEAKGQALVRAYLNEHGDLPVVGVEQRFEVDIEDPETGESLATSLGRILRPRGSQGRRDCRNQDDLEGMAPAEHPATLASRFVRNGGQRPAWRALARRRSCHSQTTNATRVEEYPVERGEPDNAWFFHAAKSIEGAIQAGHFPPSPGPTCIECEFGKACLAGRGTRVQSREQPQRQVSHRSLPVSVHAA